MNQNYYQFPNKYFEQTKKNHHALFIYNINNILDHHTLVQFL